MRGYVSTSTGQIHYREEGNGDPIVLLHGSPVSSSMWVELLPRLASAGFHAFAFDLPGFGMSDPLPEEPTLSTYADVIAEAAAGLEIDRFDMVGHHTGCSVSVELAAAYPLRVRRIICYGLLSDTRHAARLANEEPPDYDEAGKLLLSKWRHYWSTAPPDLAQRLTTRTIADMLSTGRLLPLAHRAVGRADHERNIGRLAVPTLALAGRREVLRRDTEAAAAMSAWVRFVELGDATTYVADERPEELAALITEFARADDASVSPKQS